MKPETTLKLHCVYLRVSVANIHKPVFINYSKGSTFTYVSIYSNIKQIAVPYVSDYYFSSDVFVE